MVRMACSNLFQTWAKNFPSEVSSPTEEVVTSLRIALGPGEEIRKRHRFVTEAAVGAIAGAWIDLWPVKEFTGDDVTGKPMAA